MGQKDQIGGSPERLVVKSSSSRTHISFYAEIGHFGSSPPPPPPPERAHTQPTNGTNGNAVQADLHIDPGILRGRSWKCRRPARLPAEVDLGQQLSSPAALSLLLPLQLLVVQEQVLVGGVVQVYVARDDEPCAEMRHS